MKAYLSVITLTVLSPEPLDTGAIWDLDGILDKIDDGDSVGDWTFAFPNEAIEGRDAIREQLIKMGNDGSFFDNGDDDDA